jgi:hypothetical protein
LDNDCENAVDNYILIITLVDNDDNEEMESDVSDWDGETFSLKNVAHRALEMDINDILKNV